MTEEKKYGYFNRKPKPTLEQLEEKIEKQNKVIVDSLQQFSVLSDKKFNEMRENISELSNNLKAIQEVRNIPSDWAKTISTMREIDPSLPEMSVIYSVLVAYKNLSSNLAKMAQDRTKEKLSTIKKEIVSRKIHNCSKCGKVVEEGEYYLLNDKPCCLSHKDDPVEQKTVLGEM